MSQPEGVQGGHIATKAQIPRVQSEDGISATPVSRKEKQNTVTKRQSASEWTDGANNAQPDATTSPQPTAALHLLATTTSATNRSPPSSVTPVTAKEPPPPPPPPPAPPAAVSMAATRAPVRMHTPSSSAMPRRLSRTPWKPPSGYHTPSVSSVAASKLKAPGALYGVRPGVEVWWCGGRMRLL